MEIITSSNLNCLKCGTFKVCAMHLFQSHHNTSDFDLFTLDDVDAAFDKIQQVKYMQTVSLKGKMLCSIDF